MKKIINYLDTKVIAVTGGIGSGQSTVCNYLKDLGCKIINLDLKAKQIIQKDLNLQKELKKAFGKNIFKTDKKLDTKKLASIVFVDKEKTEKQTISDEIEINVEDESDDLVFETEFPKKESAANNNEANYTDKDQEDIEITVEENEQKEESEDLINVAILLLQPHHHIAKFLAHFLHGMLFTHAFEFVVNRTVGLVFQDPFTGELTRLDFL